VRLMTLHKAKGLEFEHVFLPGWEAGIFPPHYGEIDEERRLAYVALTRGKRRVTISYAEWRRGDAGPCAFIGDIPENYRVAGWLQLQSAIIALGGHSGHCRGGRAVRSSARVD